MEFGGIKRGKKRKRKNRLHNKQRRDKKTFEEQNRKKRKTNKMDANAFWENYKAAHDWQNRHNATWWKTRCYALEHENHMLRETIRSLVQNQQSNQFSAGENRTQEQTHENSQDHSEEDDAEDDLEFQLDENMVEFLAQSIRHKIELKNKRESETTEIYEITEEKIDNNVSELVNKRTEDAKQLYGEASSRILAMETALQATGDRHVDKAKPQYWPNIPLKL